MRVQDMIPSSKAEKIIHYDARCYSGQFSNDGNFFFCCAQDFKVRMYDTSNPHDWKHYKTVRFIGGQWTITDATLSPDNKYLAISSLQKQVTLAPTDPNDKSEPLVLDFASRGSSSHGRFSVSFSSVRSHYQSMTLLLTNLVRYTLFDSPGTVEKLLLVQVIDLSESTTSRLNSLFSGYINTRTM